MLWPNDNMSAHSVTTTTRPSMLTSPAKWFSRSEPEKTFWSKLCQDCHVSSLDKSIVRPLGSKQAWDAAGPVLWHWNDTLLPVIKEYFDWNRRSILRQDGSLASIDCWMVGDRITHAKPTVIITCSGGGVATRFRRLIKHDRHVTSSGYDFLGRNGRLIATMGRHSKRSKDKALRPASSLGANRSIEQPRPQRDQGPRTNSQDSSDTSAISEEDAASPLTRQSPGPSEVQVYTSSTKGGPSNISMSSERQAEEFSSYGLTPRTGAVHASEPPELRADMASEPVQPRYVNPLFPRDAQGQNFALSSTLPETAPSQYDLMQEGSKRALTSTALSDVGRRFVEIGIGEWNDCKNFIRNHPEVLKEPQPDFLKTASEAIRDDRAGDAHRCIQQALILRRYLEAGPRRAFDNLEKLIANDTVAVKKFASDFKTIEGHLRDRVRVQQPGTTHASVATRATSQSTRHARQSTQTPPPRHRSVSGKLRSTGTVSLQSPLETAPQKSRHEDPYTPGPSQRHQPISERSQGTSTVNSSELSQPPSRYSESNSSGREKINAAEERSTQSNRGLPHFKTHTASKGKSEADIRDYEAARADVNTTKDLNPQTSSQRDNRTKSSPIEGETLGNTIHAKSGQSYLGDRIHVTSSHIDRRAVLGGQVIVKDQLWDLSVGHIFLRNGTAASGKLWQDATRSTSHTSDVFSIDTDSDEEEMELAGYQGITPASDAVRLPSLDDFETSAQIRSTDHSFVLGYQLRVIPSLSMEGDWAMLFSQNSPRRQNGNRITVDATKSGEKWVGKVGSLEHTQVVRVLKSRGGGERRRASACHSLICLPGSEVLQNAQALKMTSGKSGINLKPVTSLKPFAVDGDSGAWVIDLDTATWYGTLVAHQAGDTSQSYMIRSRDILASISEHHDGYVGLPKFEQRFCRHCNGYSTSARVPNGRLLYGGECSVCHRVSGMESSEPQAEKEVDNDRQSTVVARSVWGEPI